MKKPRLKISSFVIERLNKIEELSSGRLYGTVGLSDNTILLLGFSVTSQKKVCVENPEEQIILDKVLSYDLLPNLPAEIDFCGAFKASAGGKEIGTDGWTKELQDIDITDNPVLLKADLESREIKGQFYISNKLEDTDYHVVSEDELLQWFVTLRITARVPLPCQLTPQAIKDAFSQLRTRIASHVGFQIQDQSIYILGGDGESISGASAESAVGELLPASGDSSNSLVNRKQGTQGRKNDVLGITMCCRSSQNDSNLKTAPVVSYLKKEMHFVNAELQVDSLAFVNRQTKLSQLHGLLVEAMCRGFKLNERCLLGQMQGQETAHGVALPRTYHFLPRECGHFFTAVYPSKDSVSSRAVREMFHIQLCLPTDKPLFRPGNAHRWDGPGTLLVNPHEGLNPSGVNGGEVSLVKGLYHYHHYMQDRMDDNGWGCAYRSLQTIFSWFRLQGYSNKPVPTHKMIQQCLVDIGDKQSSFVGSSQWIGSTEVSFCLETMLGVTSRIVSVSSGEELSTKGGELSHHFRTQGTPIMIGGGVLAHTILGVDFNRKTGALKFLILDPHYTGGEDLTVIQNKGWCGWKGLEFWKKNAFYNMCLPMRAKCI